MVNWSSVDKLLFKFLRTFIADLKTYFISRWYLQQHVMRSFLEACRTKYGLQLSNKLCDIFMFGCFILKSEYTSDCDFSNIWTGWLEYVLGPMRTLFTSFLFPVGWEFSGEHQKSCASFLSSSDNASDLTFLFVYKQDEDCVCNIFVRIENPELIRLAVTHNVLSQWKFRANFLDSFATNRCAYDAPSSRRSSRGIKMGPRASSAWRGVRRLCGMYKFTTNPSFGWDVILIWRL
jgi:hypothetical protein